MKTQTLKTSTLSGAALDWAVAKCEGLESDIGRTNEGKDVIVLTVVDGFWRKYEPSKNHLITDELIKRLNIHVCSSDLLGDGYNAYMWKLPLDVKIGNEFVCKTEYANTPRIAAMRCYVASKFGDEIEVPEVLLS